MFCTIVDGGWSEWSQWSTCEKPCGGSVVNRTRLCNNPTPSNGGALCNGVNVETKLECLSQCAGKYRSIFCSSIRFINDNVLLLLFIIFHELKSPAFDGS